MKKTFFMIAMFILFSPPAWCVPDYNGYSKFLKDNKTKIREMEKVCDKSKTTKDPLKKCNELMQFRVEAECRYGINPNACKALDEIKKIKK